MRIDTQILKINPERIELDQLKIISKVLQEEGIVAYPTDTFYGLGASCFSNKAIQRIYCLKKRKPTKPLSALISDMEMVQNIVRDVPPLFWNITKKFWPGPLTLILKASSKLPEDLLGPGDTIGIRQPALSWLRKLVKKVSFPITATSANISGEIEVASPEKVIDLFFGKVELIVNGGKTTEILPSTVMDLTSRKPEILREGAVPSSLLEEYLRR